MQKAFLYFLAPTYTVYKRYSGHKAKLNWQHVRAGEIFMRALLIYRGWGRYIITIHLIHFLFIIDGYDLPTLFTRLDNGNLYVIMNEG